MPRAGKKKKEGRKKEERHYRDVPLFYKGSPVMDEVIF